MKPIQKILSRILWDEEYGRGNFEIGYYDHIAEKIVYIPFREMRFEKGNNFSFELCYPDGEVITIPFHRVREVLKDGLLIWSRPQPQ